MQNQLTRRDFMAAATVAAATSLATGSIRAAEPAARPKVAALLTHVFHRSHAHVILENFLEPYIFRGQLTDPGVDVVSFYVDQIADGDLAHAIADQYSIPIMPSIAEALTLGSTRLAVDGVLLIGEHGKYPTNTKGQVEYPRKRFFDEAVGVFERSGSVAPIFNDKHLSYRWDWAREMYDTARRLEIPFLAGSSVPLAQRQPDWELPKDAAISEAVSIHGGPVESYDFHGLDVLQSHVEGRQDGETGVEEVQFVEGEALWQAAAQGRWSLESAGAAVAAELGPSELGPRERIEKICRDAGMQPHGILLKYVDGLTAISLRVGGDGTN